MSMVVGKIKNTQTSYNGGHHIGSIQKTLAVLISSSINGVHVTVYDQVLSLLSCG